MKVERYGWQCACGLGKEDNRDPWCPACADWLEQWLGWAWVTLPKEEKEAE